ncbi:CDC16 family protein [Megaselia abdita]
MTDTDWRKKENQDEPLIDISKYRKLVKNFIECRRYQTALFWAEKIAVINNNDPLDLYMQAHCLFLLKEYHRSAFLIKNHGLEKTHILCYNLLLECLYEANEYNEAVNLIHAVDLDIMGTSAFGSNSRNDSMMFDEEKNEIIASVNLLKGKIFEAMDNRSSALDFYVQALQKSVYCVEALDALLHHEMLVAWEEKELISSLPFSQQCSEADVQLLKLLYESKLKKYYDSDIVEQNEEIPIGGLNTVKEIRERVEKIIKNNDKPPRNIKTKFVNNANSQIMSPANRILEDLKGSSSYSLHASITKVSLLNSSNFDTSKCQKATKIVGGCGVQLQNCITQLSKSTDIMAMKAGKCFYDFDYKSCLKIIDEILKRDPYHDVALTIQIGCLVELEDYNKLFYVAHKLVDRYPEKPISWYAVGCYYDIIGKSDPARRYLAKATSLDRMYGPAWLAYGHSFAKENEHDQAMAAYFKATQLMRGCHLPLLYIGVECGLTKNLELAENFFYQAMSIAPLDVFVFHELGVIKYEYDL